MDASENKQLMQRLFAGVADGDRKTFLDHIADDVVMRVTGRYSWSQTITGKEALFRDFYGHLASVLADANRPSRTASSRTAITSSSNRSARCAPRRACPTATNIA